MAGLKFLTQEQKQFYQDNGFIKLTNVYSLKEINEISDEYNELFDRKQRENKDLEAGWGGEEMKKAAGYIDYTVSEEHSYNYLSYFIKFISFVKNYFSSHATGKIYPQSANAQCRFHSTYHAPKFVGRS